MSQSSAARATTRPTARTAARPLRQQLPPRLRVVSAPATTRSRAGLVLGCGAVLVVGLVAVLLLNINLSRGAYEVHQLETEHTRLAEQQQTLQEQLDAEAAPPRLAERAAELGMVPAPGTAFVRLSDGKVLAIELPPAVTLKIAECDPSARGASATARTKNAVLQTGLHLQVPDYIERDELVRVDTRTGRFMSRA